MGHEDEFAIGNMETACGELNRMYHESVDGKIVPPVLNDYTLVEKAYSCEMTPEELLTIMSIIRMRQIC
ncbi:hypothetical protein B1222_18160 [Paenibacillus larvae subsp. pulvifaciens]|uniref:hypothetical protein n=1 Tax=Paenibacillus larvae TaxID=1464 RepID=UPI00098ED9E2|nr:hypothetical protein [Paenibacillus larvae]AQT85902.1 hypothetical protein B1222_18160 [Paenibacillus larvae subsp. pulvifaciens]AQZ45861.1 hypothetical protein B5S25_03840 [Paenibacillus larvae subsp. pulvifaciens]MBH0343736.1 hypothetical protein [Paenibacillus larvae]MCY7519698.1 hypothetical protein [Paenibacillus larvae]MCY9502584.1 hypothetical protein [Paenibacillus larvae]